MSKTIYVLDTNVLMTDSEVFTKFGRSNLVIPFKVLEELDKHKNRQDSTGAMTRRSTRFLDELRKKGSLYDGVRIAKGKGILKVVNSDPSLLNEDLDPTNADNRIISTVLSIMKELPGMKVILVSLDINLRVKCDSLNIRVEDYEANRAVRRTNELYSGTTERLVDDELIDQFYDGETIMLEKTDEVLHPNEFVMLRSSSDPKKTALSRFINYNKPLRRIQKNMEAYNIKPRNKEQGYAMDLLLDPSIKLVTIMGSAGSGKTLVALAAGMDQSIENEDGRGKKLPYRKLIVSRPVQPMGKDIGYLPGTLEEKMLPWLAPIHDNLEFIVGDATYLENWLDKGQIQIEALTYIRGRSIGDSYMIIDEAQNLTKHEVKTIITRIGEGTKIVLTGDVEQIDAMYLDATTNGLAHAIESLKDYEITGHVTLEKGERSEIATIAAKVL